ncbi:hypothetical protein CLV78_104222 [Aliiruegeria haliotis]|uniref:Uncharacterized protein n=1 Tax=Aliiruegeria haliotis TaxID=1280846 RepID=A0A2T0RRJ9_9RHOB|nr:hypothetical protein CLV78_104222 [Aliiruegeria haliotis]
MVSLRTPLATFPRLPSVAMAEPNANLLLQLIRENGCKMTMAEADVLLPRHGFSMSLTRDIVRDMAESGLVAADGFAGIELSK